MSWREAWRDLWDAVAGDELRSIIMTLLLALVVCQALQVLLMCLIALGRRPLAGWLDPDRFPKASWRRAWAEAALRWLGPAAAAIDTAPASQLLHFPQRTYCLGPRLAVGDLCDVRLADSDGTACVVKIPRSGPGNPLMARQYEVLSQLHARGTDRYGEYFPQPVESALVEGRRVNVFRWRDGYLPAPEILDAHRRGLDARHLAWMFNRMLEALGYVHSRGWVHGAVLPPHLLFHPRSHALQLVGWIHAQPLGTPLHVVPEAYKPWYPPECRQRRGVTPSVDIYLAAKSLICLSGGDALRGTMPPHVPLEMRRFVESCLLHSPAMRPQDAWLLRDEFGQLLEELYGPPRYHRLVV